MRRTGTFGTILFNMVLGCYYHTELLLHNLNESIDG